EVIQTVHAVQAHDQARRTGAGAKQAQHGKGVGRVGAGAPLLPVVQTVNVRVDVIRRAIGGQTVIPQPRVGDERLRRLELVRTNVHRAADDARVAIQIRTGRRRGVGAGVDAGRVGLQAQVATGLVHE